MARDRHLHPGREPAQCHVDEARVDRAVGLTHRRSCGRERHRRHRRAVAAGSSAASSSGGDAVASSRRSAATSASIDRARRPSLRAGGARERRRVEPERDWAAGPSKGRPAGRRRRHGRTSRRRWADREWRRGPATTLIPPGTAALTSKPARRWVGRGVSERATVTSSLDESLRERRTRLLPSARIQLSGPAPGGRRTRAFRPLTSAGSPTSDARACTDVAERDHVRGLDPAGVAIACTGSPSGVVRAEQALPGSSAGHWRRSTGSRRPRAAVRRSSWAAPSPPALLVSSRSWTSPPLSSSVQVEGRRSMAHRTWRRCPGRPR